ncbi:MAG: hypothetical protein A3K61_05160 [Thaumarchaeota archaeon RBG_16_49_8]|nr:MAG: hypothetical protein A3K61_05160 [Thaumarchaeota archaeon RBG_16_49_8]
MNMADQSQLQIIVFELDKKLYGVDIGQVKEITEIKDVAPVPNAAPFVEGVTNLRGQVTTVIDLRRRLGLPPKAHDKESRMIILETKKGLVGTIVDSVSDVSMLPRKDIENTPELVSSTDADQSFVQGVGKKDDDLILLVDLQSLATSGLRA